MGNFALEIVLDAWDQIKTFISYERTPKRAAWMRRAFEIEGSIDEWLENKEANVIEEYSKIRKITFDEAQRELMERPTKPWPDGARKNPPKLRSTLKTSKDGWNTWTLRSYPNLKMTVRERKDRLFEADSPWGIGIGERLHEAVLGIREKLEGDTRHFVPRAIEFVDQVAEYFKSQIEQ
jgi:hypothetical protein